MRIFWKKKCKKSPQVGGSVPEPPLASDGWGIHIRPPRCYYRWYYYNFVKFISSTKYVLFHYKKNNFCFFQTFAPIFRFKLCSFCWKEAQEYFLS